MHNPQLGVAILSLSRIACGTPNFSKKRKKKIDETRIGIYPSATRNPTC
jgi:hypothetical protein